MRCDECLQEPCRCQRTLAVVNQAVPQKYQFRSCATPGCTVMIGYLTGTLHSVTICKWCQAGRAYKI
jgi:hypothetical protein